MKKISLILVLSLLFGGNCFAKECFISDDFENGYINNWRLYGWDSNHISLDVSKGLLSLGIGIGGSAGSNGYGAPYFAQATAGEMAWRDYTLDTTLRFEKSSFEYGGIMVRYNNPSSYYELAFSSYSGGFLCLTKSTPYPLKENIISGTKVSFSSIPRFVVTDDNSYKIKVDKNNVKVFVNGYNVINYTDYSSSYNSGMIGFNEYSTYAAESHIFVSDLKVSDNSNPKTSVYLIGGTDSLYSAAVDTESDTVADFNMYGALYDENRLSQISKHNVSMTNEKTKYFDISEYEQIFYDDFSKDLGGYTIENTNPDYVSGGVLDGCYNIKFGNTVAAYPSVFGIRRSFDESCKKISFQVSQSISAGGYAPEYIKIIIGYDGTREIKASYWSSEKTITLDSKTIKADTVRLGATECDQYEIKYTGNVIELIINGVHAFSYEGANVITHGFGVETYSKYTNKANVLIDNLCAKASKAPTMAKLFCWDDAMKPIFQNEDIINTNLADKYYVLQGNDEAGDGSLEYPYNSLEQARNTARIMKKLSDRSIEIIILDDVYFLPDTFYLGAEDSAEDGYTITYKGKDDGGTVISAGTKIDGFTLYDAEKNIYSANAECLNFRQLYSKGMECIRARYPNNEKYLTISSWNQNSVNVSGTPNMSDFTGVEAVIQKVWGNDILNVSDISDGIMSFDSLSTKREFSNVNPPKQNNQAFHLENSLDFIDCEGEWYLDRLEDTVYYKPFKTDDLSNVYAPRLETAISVTGGNLLKKVKNIKFENLSFSHTDWNYVKENPYVEIQSQQYFSGTNYKEHPTAGIYVKNAENIDFSNVKFSDMGSTAIDFHRGVKNSKITGCSFYDIAGNGISMGVFDEAPNFSGNDIYNPKNENEIVSNITIENNFITRVGQSYYSSAGILSGNCRNVSILHNEICDLPWSGMSLSWGWSEEMPVPSSFIVKYNHIYNVLNKVSDGGGIYFCGNAPESVVSDNFIHNLKYAIYASGAMLTGIYLDLGTKGVAVSNNAVVESVYFHSNAKDGANTVEATPNNSEAIKAAAGISDQEVKRGITYEIARGKSATSSSYQDKDYGPFYLTDGSSNNNARWIASANDQNPWVQVDLGEEYMINIIKLNSTFGASYNTSSFRSNFEVVASNDESFSAWEQIAFQGGTPWNEWEQWIYYTAPTKKYRYIRIRKTPAAFFELSEISVYGNK